MSERVPQVGDSVIFCDTHGVDHNGLITVVHNANCVNLLHISGDISKQDQYGRQIERPSSVSRMSDSTAHGYYFRFPDEIKKPYKEPLSR
jgi:hypothetical protein